MRNFSPPGVHDWADQSTALPVATDDQVEHARTLAKRGTRKKKFEHFGSPDTLTVGFTPHVVKGSVVPDPATIHMRNY